MGVVGFTAALGAGRLSKGSGPYETAGSGDEGVVPGPGKIAAPVAVGPVGGRLVQVEGDVDDAIGELQGVRVIGQQ
ncbi:hypothetical protein [Streptomyces sp. NPDC058614]|uniref:hypothetical protein n=1 Tax=Streptomyces sp. NPDC058614 TaxID=3346557 RepID=UPI003662732B